MSSEAVTTRYPKDNEKAWLNWEKTYSSWSPLIILNESGEANYIILFVIYQDGDENA